MIDFLNNTLLLIIIGSVVGTLVIVAIILTIIFSVKKKNRKVEVKTTNIDNNKWVNALGGNENIKSIEAKGSRLIVNLSNPSVVNKEELHELGVSSIISSQDKVTLVLKEKAENIQKLLQ